MPIYSRYNFKAKKLIPLLGWACILVCVRTMYGAHNLLYLDRKINFRRGRINLVRSISCALFKRLVQTQHFDHLFWSMKGDIIFRGRHSFKFQNPKVNKDSFKSFFSTYYKRMEWITWTNSYLQFTRSGPFLVDHF